MSLLEARLAPAHQGAGLSRGLLHAVRANVQLRGLHDLFGPVRPTGKSREPGVSMTEYAARVRGDGLPQDPWLRVHVRASARVIKVCPASMTISDTLPQWRIWTGLPLDRTGPVDPTDCRCGCSGEGGWRDLCEHGVDGARRGGACQVVSLRDVAAEAAHELECGGVLDPFGDDLAQGQVGQ